MPEITVNLVHDLKVKRAQKTKPPFIGGLRTGYVRAWIFVVFKVWLLVALMNGVSTMQKLEQNITLLDSYVRNDFSRPEIFFPESNLDSNFKPIVHTRVAQKAIDDSTSNSSDSLPQLAIATNQESSQGTSQGSSINQYPGKVESDNITVPTETTLPASDPSTPPTTPSEQQSQQGPTIQASTSSAKLASISSPSEYTAGATQETLIQQNIQLTVGAAIADAIKFGFILGNGTPLSGCLQVNTGGILHGTRHQCGAGGGGGGSTVVNNYGSGMTVGDTIAGATQGSVLFTGAAGALSQNNANFFWDDTTHRLGIGDSTPLAALTVGSGDAFQVDGTGAIAAATGFTSSGTITFAGLSGGGVQCLQVSNTGVISGTGSACGSGGGGADTALSNLSAVAINTSLLLGVSDGGALGSTTKMWSDLFLASGAVINFNNGDVTLTHATDTLTLGGGDLIVTTAGNAAGSVLTTNATQTVTNKNLTSGTNTFPTFNQNTTGSAATLTTPRNIYGNSFNGSADLNQVIASTFGGTGSGFTKFSGPATTEKTFTLPNASATILTSDSLVTVAQGGTGSGNLTGLLLGNGTSPFTTTTTSAGIAGVLSDETGSGALVFANSPTLVTPVLGAASATSLTLSGLAGSGTQCLQVDNSGALSGTGAGCGAGAGTVTSVSGTTNRITVTNPTTTPIIDISAAYVGQASITTIGTITTGTWQGSIVASTYGGTGNGFTKFSGPAITEKTFTLPNASATILTTDSLVTVGQGGTGAGTLTGLLLGNGTSPFTATTTSAGIAGVLSDETGTGALVFANSPTFVTPVLGAASATSLNVSGLSANTAVYTDGSKNLTSTAPTSGTLGYWSRSSTILQPANAGDAITTSGNISTSGTGTITAAGLLTGSAGLTVSGGTVTLTSTGASTYTVPTNTASAFNLTNGTNSYYTADTRATTSGVSAHTFGHASSIFAAGGASSQYINATFTPGTIILNTSSDVTGTGTNSNIGVLFNQMTVGNNFNPGNTITESSNLLVNGAVRSQDSNGAGSTTLTNSYALNILSGSALNTASGAVTNGYGLSVNAPTGASNNYAAILNGGNVGVGNTAPASLFSVGSSSQFQINSSGAIAAATGITSSGAVTLSGLGGGGTQCVLTNNSGVLSAGACGGIATNLALSGLIAAGSTNTFDNANFAQTWTWNSLVNGPALTLSSNSGGSTSSQSLLSVQLVGTNVNSSQLTIAAKFANNHSGTGAINYAATFDANGGDTNYGAQFAASSSATTNVGARFSATNATNNYAAIFANGNVGIGTVTPTYLLEVAGTAHVGSLGIGSGSISSGTGIAVVPTLTGSSSEFYGIYNSSNAGLTTSTGSYYGEKIEMFNYGDGSLTTAVGLGIGFTGGSYATTYGVVVPSLASGTNNVGVAIGGATGTKHTNLLIDSGSIPTGAYSIYNNSTSQNYFNGNLGIKAISPAADIDIGSQDLGSGNVAGPLFRLGRNSNATAPAAGSVNYVSMGNTDGYVWQDNAGNIRINTSRPTNSTDASGTVVGTQTSTRDTKQDITPYTDVNAALQMVTSAPLHTFRYKKDVSGYGIDSPLAKPRIGFIADEVPGEFMWGNSIDQVSVNGILMASVKALNNKVISLTTQLQAKQNYPDLVMGQPNLAGTPIVLASQLYLTGDNVGQAKILAGETSVRVKFSKPYQYQPIVTTTPNGKVGSEYWVSDKDSMGFTINIELPAAEAIVFDWHSFAGESAKLTVSDGTSSDIVLVVGDGAPVVTPTPPVTETPTDPTAVDPTAVDPTAVDPTPPTTSDLTTPLAQTVPTTDTSVNPVVTTPASSESTVVPTPPDPELIQPRGPPAE